MYNVSLKFQSFFHTFYISTEGQWGIYQYCYFLLVSFLPAFHKYWNTHLNRIIFKMDFLHCLLDRINWRLPQYVIKAPLGSHDPLVKHWLRDFFVPLVQQGRSWQLSLCGPGTYHELVASIWDPEHALQTSQPHAKLGDILKYGFMV